MEILTGIAAFLGIVNSVYTFIEKRKDIANDDTKSVSIFLNDIGELLKQVAADLEQGIYPHDKCSIMFEYMHGMKAKLQDKMDDEQLLQLQSLIEQCYRVEQLLGQLNNLTTEEKSYNIDMMKSIAGRFIGVSRLLGV